MAPKKQASQAAPEEEMWVTKDFVAQMEERFNSLLKQQAENYQSFMETYINSSNRRIDEYMMKATSDIAAIRQSLEFTQTEVDSLKGDMNCAHTKLATAESNLTQATDQLDYLENQSRRSNLRIDGIPEKPKENWGQTEDLVLSFTKDTLGIALQPDAIERAHRTGTTSDKKAHRSIVVRFSHFKRRDEVLKAARNVKPEGVTVNEDFSKRIMDRRKALIPRLKEARSAGKIAYLSYDKLVVREKASQNRPDQPSTNAPDNDAAVRTSGPSSGT